VDDGGKINRKSYSWDRQDFGCWLWNVQRRRQPPLPRDPANGEVP
jgi:hypothetical protein